jgi:hypothetical protein
LDAAKGNVRTMAEALDIAQTVAQEVQTQAHHRLAAVVSRSLTAVFDDPYEFRIHFDRKRNRTEARLVFYRDGYEISPMDAAGGGVVDVAAFALRLSCLMLSRPPLRRFVAFDEPLKFVNGHENRVRLRNLLVTLAKEMKIQMLIVTQVDQLGIGKVVELE